MNRRSVLRWIQRAALVSVLSISYGAVAQASDDDFSGEAKKFITSLADDALTSLTEAGLGKEVRRTRFRELMLERFAFKGIAKWVLGRYWRRASESERTQYMTLFEDLMVVSYADRFENYSGGELVIGKSQVHQGKDALVHSKLIRGGNTKPIDVIWRVRKTKDAFKVIDVMVEGLSMGLTQQKEFASFIRKNGGKVSGLLDELRKRLDSNT
jgi:phospholipid transport system substrate-binding protein